MTEQLSKMVQKSAYWVDLTPHFHGCIIRKLFAHTREPHIEGSSMMDLLCLMPGSANDPNTGELLGGV